METELELQRREGHQHQFRVLNLMIKIFQQYATFVTVIFCRT